MKISSKTSLIVLAFVTAAQAGVPFELMTGVDVRKYPGTYRMVAASPGPTFGGTPPFADGDRLAGAGTTGATIPWNGVGTPLRQANDVGAMSFIFRRGSFNFGSSIMPFLGIEALGGELVDLDGDTTNGSRSLIPILGQSAVELPGTFSHIDFSINTANTSIAITGFDARGTNEGGPGANPEISLTINSIAGTTPTGATTNGINPAIDTRTGTLTAFTGTGGTLTGVYRVTNLKFEFWNDAADPNSSSPNQLGTIQQFVNARGWLVYRDPISGNFPTLAGKGLGTTLWGNLASSVDASNVNAVVNTAVTLQGVTATIRDGNAMDRYSQFNEGTTLGSGDLGVYFDAVVAPRIPCHVAAFVYLESAGFGVNNSNDPVFTDTISYDLVVVAQEHATTGDIDGDGDVDSADRALFINALLGNASVDAIQHARADLNHDCSVDGSDIQLFVESSL